MNILVTNDDGIGAEGIQVLAQAAAAFGKVTVVVRFGARFVYIIT